MVDIETLSDNIHNGLIVSVAMKAFDVRGQQPVRTVEREWYIDPEDALLYGRSPSESTLRWWTTHPAALAELDRHSREMRDFREVMQEVYDQMLELQQDYDLYVWSKGIDFDFPMLESSFRAAGISNEPPYKFWKKCDVRSWLSAFEQIGYCAQKRPVVHGAMADVNQQIAEIQRAMAWCVGNFR